ncbi:MAG: ABC transporter ATP-binding protein [Desulfobacterales bacterium]|nr:ABC transporter ATP-binding protein [Desulfobacterales bacterium]
MLRLVNVHTHYGQIHALKGISLDVEKGYIFCLIGSNGAGKTTTLMSISAIQPISAGVIEFMGRKIHTLSPEAIVRKGIVQVPEGRRIFPYLTVQENLLMGAYLSKNKTQQIKAMTYVLSLFPILKERQKQMGGTLSGGEQQMLAIGRALMSSPKFLLLDEPSLGLAPLMVNQIFEIIRTINQQGVTILLVEQNAHAALSLSHYGYVLETGKVIIQDNAPNLLQNPIVKEAYLG